jgi:hypothetical protein
MVAARLFLGTLLGLAAGNIVCAQGTITGAARINLQFTPVNPSMADGQLEVRVFADLSSAYAAGGGNPSLTGFAVPLGFDTSHVRLVSVTAGQALGYSSAGFASTDVTMANARGFVTLVNTRSGTQDSGTQVELARMVFQLVRPGRTVFLAGSTRTVHPGMLIGTTPSAGSTIQRIPWQDELYTLQISPSTSIPSLICPSWFSWPRTFQGVAFLNEGANPATIQVFGWDRTGHLASTASAINPSEPGVLLPLRQDAKVTEEIFKSTAAMNIEHGWLEVRSNQPDLSGFFIQGINSSTGGVEAMDGADMVYAPASQIFFPLLGSDPDRPAEVCLINPGNSSVSATISLMNSDGSTAQTISVLLEPHATVVQEFSRISGYVEVVAGNGELLGFERFGTPKALAALHGQSGAAASNRLTGPQFVSGYAGGTTRMDTLITLVNPSVSANQVTLRLLNEQGAEIVAPVVQSLGPKAQLASPGWRLFGLADPLTASALVVGTVAVESDQGVLGAVAFGDPVGGTYLTALPLMSTSSAKREIYFGHVAVGLAGTVNYYTGLALVNTSSVATAHINLELYDKEGNLVARTNKPYELAPKNRLAKVVQELIPDFSGNQFGGFVHLVSDVEVSAYMVFGDTAINFITAVPVR